MSAPTKSESAANSIEELTADSDGRPSLDRADQSSIAAGYASTARAHQAQGWHPIPLPAGDKWPPPTGYTGRGRIAPSGADIEAWSEDRPGDNIAVVMPDGVIGIDVDHYLKDGLQKRGGDTLAEAEKFWGALPDGPRSTRRPDDPVSGIRFFRVPAGIEFATVIDFGDTADVEIIQPHHRYAVVYGSVVDGAAYGWYDADLNPIEIPAVAELPELPAAWVEELGADPPAPDTGDVFNVRESFTGGEPSKLVAARLTTALGDVRNKGSRYDKTRGHVLALMRFGQQGQPGVAAALEKLGAAYVPAVVPDRTKAAAIEEFKRMIFHAGAAKLLAEPSHQESWQEFIAQYQETAHPSADSAAEGQPGTNTAAPDGNTQQPTGKPRLWQAAALQSVRQATFLAKNRIPYGAATILCGDEGIGKSLLWVLIVAAVTTGTELAAFGIPAREPADVILILTEDAWAEDVLPRLNVVGADMNRIHVICTEDDGTGSPTFPDDMHLITDGGVQPARVVVDAWLDTVPGNLSVKDPQQSRAALHPWKEAAGQTGAAILLLTHTNRLDTGNMRDKYGASASLRQKARMTLFALADPDTPGVLLVGPDKANNARGGTSAARFNIDAVQHWPATADHDGTVPRLKFMGDTGQTIKQHLAAVRDADREQSRAKTGAEIFLRGYLASGAKTAGEVFAAGEKAGFGERQLQRAREKCAYTQHVGTADGNHYWLWILAESANDSGGNDA
jgi:hypothetical protein